MFLFAYNIVQKIPIPQKMFKNYRNTKIRQYESPSLIKWSWDAVYCFIKNFKTGVISFGKALLILEYPGILYPFDGSTLSTKLHTSAVPRLSLRIGVGKEFDACETAAPRHVEAREEKQKGDAIVLTKYTVKQFGQCFDKIRRDLPT